jgi:hypothetical protein
VGPVSLNVRIRTSHRARPRCRSFRVSRPPISGLPTNAVRRRPLRSVERPGTELHTVCVLGNDGRVIERFDVTHDNQALRMMVSRFRMVGVTKVAIERGDGPVVEGIDRCRAHGVRRPVGSDQSLTDPLRIGRKPKRYRRCAEPVRIS